jgi:hypothetical protein
MAISEPINPMAVHLGAGVLQLYVETPVSGTLGRYEVSCSRALNGVYEGCAQRFFSQKDACLYDFTLGSDAYLRIRAIGTDGSASDWVQVKRGVASKPYIGMTCRCIEGSLIPAGAIFAIPKRPDRIVGIVATQDIEFI